MMRDNPLFRESNLHNIFLAGDGWLYTSHRDVLPIIRLSFIPELSIFIELKSSYFL